MGQQGFARFVRQAVDEAKRDRGWTMTRVAAETGIGRSTLFRWLSGEGQDFPELAKVRAFCSALQIPVASAFAALGITSEARTVDDPDVSNDVERILAHLRNPRVSPAQKKIIRDMLGYLARGEIA
jgi:DNA-binding phage protein